MIVVAFARAAHFGPAMLITTISYSLSTVLWREGPALALAFTVFLGQLLIGWSNDIYDYQDDLIHHRIKKPLVSGEITIRSLKRATSLLTPFAVIAILLGPLGFKGGAVYLLGVGCGITYNFYFKFKITSPLPYLIACAALPASIFYAVDRSPPILVLVIGSLLGVAFHFANVLKDLNADRKSQIRGLPQRVGRELSILLIFLTLIAVFVILILSPVLTELSTSI